VAGVPKRKKLKQKEKNKEILRHVLSADLILGKKLFLMAEKDPDYVKAKECKNEMDK